MFTVIELNSMTYRWSQNEFRNKHRCGHQWLIKLHSTYTASSWESHHSLTKVSQDFTQGGRWCPVLNVPANTASTQAVQLAQSLMANGTDIQRKIEEHYMCKEFSITFNHEMAYNSLQMGTAPRMIQDGILTLWRAAFPSTGESLKHNPL